MKGEPTLAEVRSLVKQAFPYSTVQPFLLDLVVERDPSRTADISTQAALDFERGFIEVEIKFDVDKFWDELANRLYNG